MMEILGYAASLVIGISLGLLGGGGSILTVPVLVYLLGLETLTATAYSLFIVGVTSLIGTIQKLRLGLVNLRSALAFGLPSILAVFTARKYLVPQIPDLIRFGDGFQMNKSDFLLLSFALLMLVAAIFMIRNGRRKEENNSSAVLTNYPLIILLGLLIGIVAGLLGAGGGFLIIPALVLFANLPMKEAIGTSLLIIAAQSLIGFLGDLSNTRMNWEMLTIVTALSIVGLFIGLGLSKKTDGRRLKTGFGWLVLGMGLIILIQQIFFR